MQSISLNLSRSIAARREKWLEDICRNHVTPPIKGEITYGKIRWRGLSLGVFPEAGCECVFQRGKRVGPVFAIESNV